MDEIKKYSKVQEDDIKKLKATMINLNEYNEVKQINRDLEKELFSKSNDITELLQQISNKNISIDELKQNIRENNYEKIKNENEIASLRTKIQADKDVIEAFVNENNNIKDEVLNLRDKVSELNHYINDISKDNKNPFQAEAETERLRRLIKSKENTISELLEELKNKENELKELTLDTIEKMLEP